MLSVATGSASEPFTCTCAQAPSWSAGGIVAAGSTTSMAGSGSVPGASANSVPAASTTSATHGVSRAVAGPDGAGL